MASVLSNELPFPVASDRICTEQILVSHNLEEVATADVPRSHVECPACGAKSQPEDLPSIPRAGPPQMCQREEASLPAHECALDGPDHFQIISHFHSCNGWFSRS